MFPALGPSRPPENEFKKKNWCSLCPPLWGPTDLLERMYPPGAGPFETDIMHMKRHLLNANGLPDRTGRLGVAHRHRARRNGVRDEATGP